MKSIIARAAFLAGASLLLTALVFLIAKHSRADTEQPRVRLGPWTGRLEVGPGMNAAGRRLRGSQFVGQDLSGARFDGCDLDGVRFYQCDLSGASFKGAHLTGAIIGDCQFEGADFTDAVINGIVLGDGRFDLYDLRLSEQQFTSTRSYEIKDLSNCMIYGLQDGKDGKWRYDFRGADLREATIVGGDFTESDFTNADVSGITLRNCTIRFDQLAATKTFRSGMSRRILFDGAQIEGKADFSGVRLAGSRFSVSFASADFTGAEIRQCWLGRAITQDHLRSTKSYHDGDLREVVFAAMGLSGFDFSGQNLTGCQFILCHLTHANFEDAVITGADFSPLEHSQSGLTPDQIKSTWNYKHGRMEGVRLPQHIGEALTDERAPQ